MKTRAQLSSKNTPETNDAVNPSADNRSKNQPPSNRSPSPPRLRDRRASSMESKSVPATANCSNKSPSPPAGAKRPSTVPTRVLPRRSCSLLASGQQLTSAISHTSNSKPSSSTINKSSSDDQTSSSKKDAHRPQTTTTPISNASIALHQSHQVYNKSKELPTFTTDKTANIRNYSKPLILTKRTVPPKLANHDKNSLNNNNNNNNTHSKNKLLRISLPDNSLNSSNTTDVLDLSEPKDLCTSDKNRYVVTVNGLRRISNNCIDIVESPILRDDSIPHVSEGSRSGEVARQASSSALEKNFNILIGVTGSVATIKLVELTNKIKSMFPRPYINKSNGATYLASVRIKIVMTQNSKHFSPKEELIRNLCDSKIEIYDDDDEWKQWKRMGDPVLHIELRKWADLCLIAPLDANTMAKLANGICDNLLTCVARAWDTSKPLIYCPAMNVHMFNHPVTREQLCKLQSFGYLRVDCVEKRLACGDVGIGGMASTESIANKIIETLINPIVRNGPLPKPILNQQPTYPIISTNDAQKRPIHVVSRVSNLGNPSLMLNRFRANNQTAVHVANSITNQYQQSLLDHGFGVKRRKGNEDGTEVNVFIEPEKRLPNNSGQSGNDGNGKHKMGGVTSVQNLKAIAMDNGKSDGIEGSGYNTGDEEFGDFDPSKLLEQTMITDESSIVEEDNRKQTSTKNSNESLGPDSSSALSEDGHPKLDGLTPLFNTSKFLALCHNKERGCFTCTICKHDYKNRKSMARHLKEQHVQGNIYQCKPCGVSYKRREKLIKHNRERHPETSSS